MEMNDPSPEYIPAEQTQLRITRSPGANVYLVAVDKGIYVLNNKTRLKKVPEKGTDNR